ncbi:MAG: tRNA-dihydrouridine synthase family protein [Verrucomicrobiota bacterium]
MQNVTTLPFWRVLARRGGPDVYVTEYFRVHANSTPESYIVRSIVENPTGRPVLAQMIGNDPFHLTRTARELERLPVAGIDLNLGCPAPSVCGKASGGALLRDPERIREIIFELRSIVGGLLTVKTRIGFESADEFAALLNVFADLPIDHLAIHGRTVRERYQSEVHTNQIREAVLQLPFSVIANGNIVSVQTARAIKQLTAASGLMIGRGAIRNPWLFEQIRQSESGLPIPSPSLRDLHSYILELFEEVALEAENYSEENHVHRMKKYTNYIANGISDGLFEAQLRRARSTHDFQRICSEHLNSEELLPNEPQEDGKLFCGFSNLLDFEA